MSCTLPIKKLVFSKIILLKCCVVTVVIVSVVPAMMIARMVSAIGVQHTSPKSGYKLVTLFGSHCDDGVMLLLGSNTSPKYGCLRVTLFGSFGASL